MAIAKEQPFQNWLNALPARLGMALYVLLPLWLRKGNRRKRIVIAIFEEIKGMAGAIVSAIWRRLKRTPPTWAIESQVDEAKILPQHVLSTYNNLRYGLVIIGFMLPLFLWIIGEYWYGIRWKESMSDYYWAHSDIYGPWRNWFTERDFFKFFIVVLDNLDGNRPMRIWFVGLLFVLGKVFLSFTVCATWDRRLMAS
jgi:hypothetical protein